MVPRQLYVPMVEVVLQVMLITTPQPLICFSAVFLVILILPGSTILLPVDHKLNP